MTSTLITGIAELVTNDDELAGADHSEGLGLVPDAAVIVEDDRVLWVGAAARRTRGRPSGRRWRPRGYPRLRRQPRAPGVRR